MRKGRESLTGFYCEHASIFDRQGLVDLATDAGLPGTDVEAVLDSDAYRADVESDGQRFKVLGGRSTPFFVVGGRSLPPSQEASSLAAALTQAWIDRQKPAAVHR